MSDEEKNSNIKDVINATTGLVKAVPVYEDLIQPAAKEVGLALGTVAKTVNIALAPISAMIWSYDTIKDFVSSEVSKKLNHIPKENIISPNPVVAGPVLEALKYTGHEETLREMYANLLANALDMNTKDDAHPSFVEIIKQLSPGEAKLLLVLSELKRFPEVCSYSTREVSTGGLLGYNLGVTSNQVNHEFLQLCSEFDIYIDFAAALDNFRRLQILYTESNTAQNIQKSWAVNLGLKDDISNKIQLETTHTEKLFFTVFGIKFIEICVKNKE